MKRRKLWWMLLILPMLLLSGAGMLYSIHYSYTISAIGNGIAYGIWYVCFIMVMFDI